MSVESVIQDIVDRVAKLVEDMGEIAEGGTSFWTSVDGAADQTFEDRVKGSTITAVDLATVNQTVWDDVNLKQLFSLISDYFRLDLGLASPYWASYLASVGWRIPYSAGQALADALGTNNRLPAQYIFPKGTLVADAADPTSARMHEFMRLTGTAGAPTELEVDGALSSYIKGAAILAVNTTADITLTDLVLECTLQDGATKLDVAYDHDEAVQYTQGIVGVGAIGVGGAAAGQADVLVKSAITQFTDGEWVLLAKADDSVHEIAQIASSDTLTLTMEDDLINSWLEDDLIIPLFTNVALKSGTVSADDVIRFYARPDRIIAL